MYSTASSARNAYVDNSVATASPERLLVMLCDRLVLDVQRGVTALSAGSIAEAHGQLVHAQEVVTHLRSTLRVEGWDGGPGLASLYDWLHAQLVQANIRKDAGIAEGCLTLAQDLASTWREAALQAVAPVGASPAAVG
jgi:flagellar secretion chaperone FliS